MSEAKKSRVVAPEGILLGMGNPLLDISVNAEKEFLDKFGLEANNAILAEEKHVPMYQEMVDTMKVEYIAGGATQNSIRVAQWLLGSPNAASYFGCIGNDEFGKTLTKIAKDEGKVNVCYQINETVATGTCAVIVTDSGKNRSLVANLAAANAFTLDHVDKAESWQLVEKAKMVYIAGFFLTVCPPAIMKIAKHVAETDKTLVMNLSAPFLCQFFKEPMLAALPYVDVLFGNETEAATFAKENDLQTEDIKEIAKKCAAWPKENKDKSRLVVFTQGDLPVVVCKDGKVSEYSVPKLSDEEMVDTNGAGDAFVGGFLARYVLGDSVPECVETAKRVARLIIGRSGCTFPAEVPEDVFTGVDA